MPVARTERRVTAPPAMPTLNQLKWLSLGERVKLLRERRGFTSHAALSDEVRKFLPRAYAMNRRWVQCLERDEDVFPIDDVQLVAIAKALRVPPTFLGVDVEHSTELGLIRGLTDLRKDASWRTLINAGHGPHPPRKPRFSDALRREVAL